MPNDIKLSREISEWLEGQGINIEVDEHAPMVFRSTGAGSSEKKEALVVIHKHLELLDESERDPEEVYEYDPGTGAICFGDVVCPYFGPGGADNLLKALAAWCNQRDKGEEGHYFFELVCMGVIGGKERWHIDLMLERKGKQALCVGDGDGDAPSGAIRNLILLIKETGCLAD